MPKGNMFEVEYAKSSMATCRVCMAKIPKGVLRIGHLAAGSASNIEMPGKDDEDESSAQEEKRMMKVAAAPRWHHFECFNKMKGTKWMAANLPEDPSILKGFSSLDKQDRRRLLALWKAILSIGSTAFRTAARKREMEISAASAEAKKKARGSSAAVTKLTSVQGVLGARDFKQIEKLEQELTSSTAAQLRAELLKNNQVRTGKKDELVQLVAEGRHLGALPPCPRCERGHLHWSRVGGWFSCPGYFDQETKIQKRCNFRTQNLERVEWRK
mmetsp:Transcript_50319/g.145941  ORF Transcript_50319/g.145941 Transcript_50319/m.145941 type:complete len:271 (+) Transcript_50319:78-890(+)